MFSTPVVREHHRDLKRPPLASPPARVPARVQEEVARRARAALVARRGAHPLAHALLEDEVLVRDVRLLVQRVDA